jgi:hypothetical protein
MSASPIYVWLASDASQQPTSLEDVGPILEDLEKRSANAGGVTLDKTRTAAFVGLAKALLKKFPTHAFADGELPWEHDLVKDAKDERGLVMNMEPPTSLMYADMIFHVLSKQAKKFGLVVFFHDVGLVFKADGSVLPEQVSQAQEGSPPPRKILSAKEVMSLVLKEVEPAILSRGYSVHVYEGAWASKTRWARTYRRDYGPLVQEFSIEIDTRGTATFSIEGRMDLKSTEQSGEFFWAKEVGYMCRISPHTAWEDYLKVPLNRQDNHARTVIETEEERKKFAGFMDACFLNLLDGVNTVESFDRFISSPPRHYFVHASAHTMVCWWGRNARYLHEVEQTGRGRNKVNWFRSTEMATSWLLEQQISELLPDGQIDFESRVPSSESDLKLDHQNRLSKAELERCTTRLSALEHYLSEGCGGFALLPIDPYEPLIRRWTRNVGALRQELRIALAWSMDRFLESAVCYFYADAIEAGYRQLGLEARGNFAGYASMSVLVSEETFKRYGCFVPPRPNGPTSQPRYVGFTRNDEFDVALFAEFIQNELLPKLNNLSAIERFAQFIHAAEPKTTVAHGTPPEEPALYRTSHLHLYDRSIMLGYLTNHPILKDYQALWPNERQLFINEKGEIAPLAKQIDVMLAAIAKVQA